MEISDRIMEIIASGFDMMDADTMDETRGI